MYRVTDTKGNSYTESTEHAARRRYHDMKSYYAGNGYLLAGLDNGKACYYRKPGETPVKVTFEGP